MALKANWYLQTFAFCAHVLNELEYWPAFHGLLLKKGSEYLLLTLYWLLEVILVS